MEEERKNTVGHILHFFFIIGFGFFLCKDLGGRSDDSYDACIQKNSF